MNWSKIKTIMICFLLAMNIFLVAFMAASMFRESAVPQEVVSAAAQILKNDGFECDENIIPHSTYELPVLSANFYSESALSEIFFKKQLAFKTENKSLVATEDDSVLTVSDNYFLFESGRKADKSFSSGKIKKALEEAGIDMQGAVYDEKERCFYRMYNGVNLFNMYIQAELDSDKELCFVSALWPGKLSSREEKILSFTENIKNVKQAFPEGGKIDLIENGYALNILSKEKSVFVPAWRVRVNGNLKILD